MTFTAPGTYEYLCTVPGHAAGGMKGLLTVVGSVDEAGRRDVVLAVVLGR